MSSSDNNESVKLKLDRALRSKAVLAERSKQLQQQVEDFRTREESMSHVAKELLERQRELNYMLHRASSVLHQLQDTNMALSAEFTHIVKELPAPEEKNWDETVSRVNDLFKKTHELAGDLQEEIFRSTREPEFPRLHTESAPSPESTVVAEAVAETSAPELQSDEQYAPCHGEIHEAEISDIIEAPQVSHDEVGETVEPELRAEQSVVEDEDARIQRLFARVDEMEFGDGGSRSDMEQKPGFFARLFSRINEEA